MKTIPKALALAIVTTATALSASAGDFALKTNILYDATASVNLGAEFGIARQWSLDISGDINFWNVSDQKRWRHNAVYLRI